MKREHEKIKGPDFGHLYHYLTDRVRGQEKALEKLCTEIVRNEKARAQYFYLASDSANGKSCTVFHFYKYLESIALSVSSLSIQYHQILDYVQKTEKSKEQPRLYKFIEQNMTKDSVECVVIAIEDCFYECRPFYDKFKAVILKVLKDYPWSGTRIYIFFATTLGKIEGSREDPSVYVNRQNKGLLLLPFIIYAPLSLESQETILLDLWNSSDAMSLTGKRQYIQSYFSTYKGPFDPRGNEAKLKPLFQLIHKMWNRWPLLCEIFRIKDVPAVILHFYSLCAEKDSTLLF